MKAAKFRVSSTFALRSRQLFVLAGEIVDGELRAGMVAEIRCNPSFAIDAPIHGVEFLDGPGDRSEVGLTVCYADEEELATWEALNIANETLVVNLCK